MARLLTQKDVYAIINAMAEDLTGGSATVTAVDTSSFISVGELVMSYGTENVLNSLGMLMGRILIASRPYEGKFNLINAIDTGVYSHRIEKISYYSRGADALPSGAWNTDLYTNLAEGFTNGQNVDSVSGDAQSTKSMWEQHYVYPLEMNFAGSSVWDACITIPEVQLQQCMRDEGIFNELLSGMLTEHNNDIETQKEAFRVSVVLNFIAGIYDMNAAGKMPGSVVNLTEAFNKYYYGSDTTSYKTSAQLRSTYLKEFLEFMTSELKDYMQKMTNRSENFHWTPAKTVDGESLKLFRHTEKSRQRLFMFEPLFRRAEAIVMPEIFNDRYLTRPQYEGIEYWQCENDPSSVSVTPAIPDATTGYQTTGSAVSLDYVVALLFDEDACMTDFQLERVDSTPLEARKLYRNLWLHASRNNINDFTEKAVLFIMADPVTEG